MDKNHQIYEKYLYPIWEKQEFTEEIKTADGKEIKILSVGERNSDSGPDFKNAKILINNIIFIGDIEIEIDYSAWKSHGHNINKNYNHVILHLSINNPTNLTHVYAENGRKIPSVNISKYLSMDFIDTIKNQEFSENKDKIHLKCEDKVENVDYFIKEKFVAELGFEKYQQKISRMKHRLLELKFLSENQIKEPKINYELPAKYYESDFLPVDFKQSQLWEQLFYEYLAESLGFMKNREPMRKLAILLNLDYLRKIGKDENQIIRIQSMLFAISGLLTNFSETEIPESDDYQRELLQNWSEIKTIYDSEFMNELDWQFFKMRPQNFPTIRIAALSKFVSQILNENLIKQLFREINSEKKIAEIINNLQGQFIQKSFGFWKNHFTFYKPAKTEIKYFVGQSRANEIIINVVLPFFGLYSEIFGLSDSNAKILKILNIYKMRNEYQVVNELSNKIGLDKLINRGLFSQGILFLYKNYCTKNRCKECKIGKEVFS